MKKSSNMTRVIVGISGASGVIYGIRLLEAFKSVPVETHLIMSEWAEKILALETDCDLSCVNDLAAVKYDNRDMTAPVASGSFLAAGMVIAPCSMKTLAGIANGYSQNLLERTADVTIKEGRKLVLVPRETPLSAIHLENMLKLARMGVVIAPPMPAFYINPKQVCELVDHHVGKIMDQFGVSNTLVKRWQEKPLPMTTFDV
jgi:4-hydroxy-3-polyprenylbenzoate decarboxylase